MYDPNHSPQLLATLNLRFPQLDSVWRVQKNVLSIPNLRFIMFSAANTGFRIVKAESSVPNATFSIANTNLGIANVYS